MGYLNNTAVTVDAILTAKGRELLAPVTVLLELHNLHCQTMRLITLCTIQHSHQVPPSSVKLSKICLY